MSGTPKYCQAELQARQREAIERERKRKAAEEEIRRKEAEAFERRKQLEEARASLKQEHDRLVRALALRRTQIHASDGIKLDHTAAEVLTIVAQITDPGELYRARAEVMTALRELDRAVFRKHQDDELRRLQLELDRLRVRATELRLELQSNHEDALKFDKAGGRSAETALESAINVIAASTVEDARKALDLATKAIARHLETVNRRRREHERKRFEAEIAAGELDALVAGLRTDSVAMRWHGNAIHELAAEAERGRSAIVAEHFEVPGATLVRAREAVSKLVAEANEAQLKADHRDYVARAIVDALKAMDFEVSAPVDTHPGHPLSPLEVHAADSLNRHLYVSVPVEGKVMYTVDGFPMSTAISADGIESSACDAAERVLLDMQERLDASAGITMGEIWWEGKDPNRNLRSAKPLDRATGTHREDS